MPNKVAAWGIFVSLGISLLTGFLGLSEDLYTIAGLGLLVFGAVGAAKLVKIPDNWEKLIQSNEDPKKS